jgi:hypothetical protein
VTEAPLTLSLSPPPLIHSHTGPGNAFKESVNCSVFHWGRRGWSAGLGGLLRCLQASQPNFAGRETRRREGKAATVARRTKIRTTSGVALFFFSFAMPRTIERRRSSSFVFLTFCACGVRCLFCLVSYPRYHCERPASLTCKHRHLRCGCAEGGGCTDERIANRNRVRVSGWVVRGNTIDKDGQLLFKQ